MTNFLRNLFRRFRGRAPSGPEAPATTTITTTIPVVLPALPPLGFTTTDPNILASAIFSAAASHHSVMGPVFLGGFPVASASSPVGDFPTPTSLPAPPTPIITADDTDDTPTATPDALASAIQVSRLLTLEERETAVALAELQLRQTATVQAAERDAALADATRMEATAAAALRLVEETRQRLRAAERRARDAERRAAEWERAAADANARADAVKRAAARSGRARAKQAASLTAWLDGLPDLGGQG
ncbi:hypothetical protein EDC01DRAFT_783772 [Geopyxis carbonaria]|nr:hypothetical protein EDC01DRAFT_783772 [Geopyxis carbonaria]